jgi:hypothetical protein
MSATNRKRARTASFVPNEFSTLNTQLRNAYLEQLYFAIRDDLRRELYADDSWSIWKSPNKKNILACLAQLEKAVPKSDETYLANFELLKAVFSKIAEKMSENENFCLSAANVVSQVDEFISGEIALVAASCNDANALREKMDSFALSAKLKFSTIPALSQRFTALDLALSCNHAALSDQLAAVTQNPSSVIPGVSTPAISKALYNKVPAQDAAAPEPQSAGNKASTDLWKTIGRSINAILDENYFKLKPVSLSDWFFGVGEYKKGKLIKAIVAAVDGKDCTALEKAVEKFQAYWLKVGGLSDIMAGALKNLSNQAALLSSDKVCAIRVKLETYVPKLFEATPVGQVSKVRSASTQALGQPHRSDSDEMVSSERGQEGGLSRVFSAQAPPCGNLLSIIGSSKGIARNCDEALAKFSRSPYGSFSGEPTSRRSFCEGRALSRDSTTARH